MARLFISHSSANNDKAVEVRDWLAKNGWDDVFLDLDPEHGIVAGQRWKEALQKAAYRCEVVLALVSKEWLASGWCKSEIDAARLMGKKVIAALVGVDKSAVPVDLTDEQFIDLTGDPQAYGRLKEGLKRAGLDPTSFPFEPAAAPIPDSPISKRRTPRSSSGGTGRPCAASTQFAGSRAPASIACSSSSAPRDPGSRRSCARASGSASRATTWRGCRSRSSGPSARRCPENTA